MVLTEHRKTAFIILIIIAVLLLVYKCGRDSVIIPTEKTKKEYIVDTIYKTIKGDKIEVVKYKDRVITLKEKVKTIVYDTAVCSEIVAYKDSIINNQDTIILIQDTIIYKYDTIYEIQKEIITDLKKPRSKFDIGLIGGYGVGQNGFSPFAGIGVSFNPFRK